MANIRMFPPASGNQSTITLPSGRVYTAAANGTLDVIDYDALVLENNGWVRAADAVGATASRPAGLINRGFRYYDTSLAFDVVWDGLAWRRADTGAVA